MIRINLSYILKLNEHFDPLAKLNGEKKWEDIFLLLAFASQKLEELFKSSVYSFRTSRQSAEALYELLLKHINATDEQKQATISAWEIGFIATYTKAFQMALNDEFGIMPSYLVTPKGGYDVNVLTLSPQDLFSSDLLYIAPETKYDVEQAAKCLAFEVPTAAAFHLHRINEAVLRRYWDVVTSGSKHPNSKSMGAYLGELKKRKKGDAKTKATLEHIRDLHRNPVMHPEHNLTLQEAIELYGIIASAVSRMLFIIQNGKPNQTLKISSNLQSL